MGLFGNLFDFNRDGKASMFEEMLGLYASGLFDEDQTTDDEDNDPYEDDEI